MKTLKDVLDYLVEHDAHSELMQATEDATAYIAKLRDVIGELLHSCELNLEEIEPETADACERAREVLALEVAEPPIGPDATVYGQGDDGNRDYVKDAVPPAVAQARAINPADGEEGPDAECGNCGATWQYGEMDEVDDFWERVEPGGTMPSGECPECGGLCYPPEEHAGARAIDSELLKACEMLLAVVGEAADGLPALVAGGYDQINAACDAAASAIAKAKGGGQ